MTSIFRYFIIAVTILMVACGAWAQEQTETSDAEESATVAIASRDFDSRTTRDELYGILERHPREVGVMLKLDPSLFENEAWITSYPALREFVTEHPEVPLNASYYLQRVYVSGDHAPVPPAVAMARQTMEGVTIFGAFLMVILTVSWLIRTLLEHRRWSRVSKVQTEMANKLLDRFTSHEDLLKYVQSAAGNDFIQSAIQPIPARESQVAAPISRVLWSVQAGVILVALGIGLQIVSGRLHPDVSASFSTLGILALCGGVGFVASAFVAWILARKLGVLPEPDQGIETEPVLGRTLGE